MSVALTLAIAILSPIATIGGPKYEDVSIESAPEYSYKIATTTNFYKADDDTKTLYTLEEKEENPVYELSADGWNAEDTAPIVLTIRETFAPLERVDKMVYAYVYKIDSVNWNGAAVATIEGYDYSYELAKPATEGTYNLSITFVKTMLSYKDITNVEWASLFTTQNLMVALSWVVLFGFTLAMFVANRKLKKNEQYTLSGVKKSIVDYVDAKLGQEFAKKTEEFLDVTVKQTYIGIDKKLNTVDETVASMARCMMLLADGTPEARVTLLKELSTIQSKDEELAKKITAMIDEQVAKQKSDKEEKEKALEEAKAITEKYLTQTATNEKEAEDEDESIDVVRPVE